MLFFFLSCFIFQVTWPTLIHLLLPPPHPQLASSNSSKARASIWKSLGRARATRIRWICAKPAEMTFLSTDHPPFRTTFHRRWSTLPTLRYRTASEPPLTRCNAPSIKTVKWKRNWTKAEKKIGHSSTEKEGKNGEKDLWGSSLGLSWIMDPQALWNSFKRP